MSELDDATHDFILDDGDDDAARAATVSFMRSAGFSRSEINALFGETKDHLPGQHNQKSHGNAHSHGKYGHIEAGAAYVATGAGATKFASSKTYEEHVKRVQKTLDEPPAKFGIQYRDKVKHLMEEANHLGMTDHIVPLKKKIGESFYKESNEAVAAGKMKTANKLAAKALEMGYEPGKAVEAPSLAVPSVVPPTGTVKAPTPEQWQTMTFAQKQASIKAEAQQQAAAKAPNPMNAKQEFVSTVTAATDPVMSAPKSVSPEVWAHLTPSQKLAAIETGAAKGTPINQATLTQTEKNAMQTKPLNTSYLAGSPNPSPAAQAILTEFNNKYVGKEITTKEALAEKMTEYAQVKQKLSAIKIAEHQQWELAQKETQLSLKKMAAEQTAKKAAEFAAKYGNDPKMQLAYTGLKKVSDEPELQIQQAEKKIAKFESLQKLHPMEAASIAQYTGSAYREINSMLRKGAITSEHHALTQAIDSGLDKLPPYKGLVLRRKNNLPMDVVANYKEGMVVTERAFTSTSTKDIWNGKWLFQIQSKTGKDVKSLSKHEHEHEILFKRNTEFLVKKVEGFTITMEEV